MRSRADSRSLRELREGRSDETGGRETGERGSERRERERERERLTLEGKPHRIGAACARALWAEGASLALTCFRNRGPADELAAELLGSEEEGEARRRITVHVVDTGAVADLERLFGEMAREHGQAGPDILVSNAGHGRRIPDILDIPLDEFEHTLNVNLRASFVLAQRSVPHMQQRRWGRIVFISSIAASGGGINGCHCTCIYSSSLPLSLFLSLSTTREPGPG